MKTYKVYLYIEAETEHEAENKFCDMDREELNDSISVELYRE